MTQQSREWDLEVAAPSSSTHLETARERRHRLGDTLAAFEKAVSAPHATDGWLDLVEPALRDVRQALERHIEVTEGRGGFLEEIGDEAPRLANEIALMEVEHRVLLEEIVSAQNSLRQVGDPRAIRNRALAILVRLSLHRQRGADLVYEAYNVDIAAGD